MKTVNRYKGIAIYEPKTPTPLQIIRLRTISDINNDSLGIINLKILANEQSQMWTAIWTKLTEWQRN